MKYILSILIFVFINSSTLAQQFQLDSLVHTVKGKQYIAVRKYNVANKRAEIARYQRENENSELQKIENFTVLYDALGNELQSVFSIWNPDISHWEEQEKTEKEFNIDNKLTRTVTYRKKKNEWIKEFENIRSYSDDSTIQVDYELKEEKFQPTHKNITVVNENGQTKNNLLFVWDKETQNWRQTTRTENQFQKDTILIGYDTYEWNDNQWQNQEKVVYEIDNLGIRTDSYTTYIQSNNDLKPVEKFEYIEIPEERKEINRTYKWLDAENEWQLRSQIVTYHNVDGQKQDVVYSSLDPATQQLTVELERMRFYDKQGRLNLFQEFSHNAGETTGTQSTVKFDEDGNVYHEGVYVLDSDTDQWIEEMSTEISFDKNIVLDDTFNTPKRLDSFGLNPYNYNSNKNAVKNVKIYQHEDGKKVLSEEYEFFYTESK